MQTTFEDHIKARCFLIALQQWPWYETSIMVCQSVLLSLSVVMMGRQSEWISGFFFDQYFGVFFSELTLSC
jgi:hypothetical protein